MQVLRRDQCSVHYLKPAQFSEEGQCCFVIVDRIVKSFFSELRRSVCIRRLTFRDLTEEAHLDTLDFRLYLTENTTRVCHKFI